MGFIREDYQKEKKSRLLARVLMGLGLAVMVLVLLRIVIPGKGKPPPPAPEMPSAAAMARVEAPKPLDVTDIVKKVQGSIVTIETFDASGASLGMGTGFILASSGQIVTNHHVIKGADQAKVKIKGQTLSVSGFLAEDVEGDLIVLAVPKTGIRLNEIPCSSQPPEVGEKVVVIGNPLGLELSVSDGIVAAKRSVPPFGDVIQITSPISPGSSGSPVLNMRGEVIGVATFAAAMGQNINFAIPIAKVINLKTSASRSLALVSSEIGSNAIVSTDPLEQAAFLIDKEHFSEALPILQEIVGRETKNARAHALLGACYIKSKPDRAKNELEWALEISPELPEAHYFRGVLFFELKRFPEAVSAFEEAVRYRPDYYDALVELAAAYYSINQFKSASDSLNRALKIKEDPKLYSVLGLVYAQMSRHLEAIRILENAIDRDENCREAYLGLAYVMIKVKNWKRGIRYMTTASVKWPDVPEMRFFLGLFYLGDEDIPAAEEQVKVLGAFKDKDSIDYRIKLSAAINQFKNYKRFNYDC